MNLSIECKNTHPLKQKSTQSIAQRHEHVSRTLMTSLCTVYLGLHKLKKVDLLLVLDRYSWLPNSLIIMIIILTVYQSLSWDLCNFACNSEIWIVDHIKLILNMNYDADMGSDLCQNHIVNNAEEWKKTRIFLFSNPNPRSK